MTRNDTILSYTDFGVSITESGTPIVSGIDFELGRGEVIGLIGESGAGKSTIARAALGLVAANLTSRGEIRFGESDVLDMSKTELRNYRMASTALIAQDPRSSVNPMHGVRRFMYERDRARGVRTEGSRRKAEAALEAVGLDPDKVLNSYPHELSGGMLQRVVIATALMAEAELLIADEPTTALDVTSQAEVMAILKQLTQERGLSMILVTHNLEIASSICDRLFVLRHGELIEAGSSEQVMRKPRDAYTVQLIEATRVLAGELALAPQAGEETNGADA